MLPKIVSGQFISLSPLFPQPFSPTFLHQNSQDTIEPDNLRTALATNFSAWSLPDARKKHLNEFLGQGIFTTDGEAWKHSREIIRPSFSRHRIEDVEGNLEKHCQRLIGCIQPGEQVDLQPLFFAFTMDVATEFLFGESSDVLLRLQEGSKKDEQQTEGSTVKVKDFKKPEDEEVTAEDFVEAYTYAQAAMEGVGDENEISKWFGFLALVIPLPHPKVKRCYKIINRE